MASDYIHVALMSGRAAQVPVTMDRPLKRIKFEAQSALQTGMGLLRDSTGRILDDWQTAETRLASHKLGSSFAALIGDGSVVTWGDPDRGGDSSHVQEKLRNMCHIQATEFAFAAVLDNGSVVTWGVHHRGGDSSRVQEKLRNV